MALVFLAVVAGIASAFLQSPKLLAIFSAGLSAFSGWLSIRNREDEVRVTTRDHIVLVGWRKLTASDRATALFFLQLALVTQAAATLLQS